ncbi:MAG: iron-containing alcohol dehydrogenase [Oleispira sp.]
MKNFSFQNTTQIHFGEGQIKSLSKQIPSDAKVLITYGGGSIKSNGVYDQVVAALSEHTFFEFSGIEPNPSYDTLMKAQDIIKENNIDFILAVGADYVVEDNDGKGIDDGVWSAGAKQLKLNTSADCVIDSQFGVIGNNSNNASIGLQAALNYSVSDGKNLKTKMGGGVRRLVTGLVLNKGNWLEGTGTSHNTGTPSDSRGTLLRPSIGSNITVISTSLTSSDQPYTLKDFGISGSSTGSKGLELFGRNIRLEDLLITDCSTGVEFHRTDFAQMPTQFVWVNFMTRCVVSHCDIGIFNRSSDSRFTDNYFSDNALNRSLITGGCIWHGNHFDRSTTSGLRFDWDDTQYDPIQIPTVSDRIIGNYFDINSVGLEFTGSYTRKIRIASTVDGNIFRDNDTAMQLGDVTMIGFGTNIIRGKNAAGVWGGAGVRFLSPGVHGTIGGLSISEMQQADYIVDRPPNVSIRNLAGYVSDTETLRSESDGRQQILLGDTTLVVPHGLYDTPTDYSANVSALAVEDFYVVAVTADATNITIRVNIAALGDRFISWRASV